MKQITNSEEKPKVEKSKPLDFFMLQYFFHHPNTPMNAKTMFFALRNTGFKLNYMQVQLSFNRRRGYLFEPVEGIFMMTPKNYLKIKEDNPALAKEIMLKSKLLEEW